jgi:hypothetical protein
MSNKNRKDDNREPITLTEAYIQGMSDSLNISFEAVEELQKSINDVMGIYLEHPLNKHKDKLTELESMYYLLSALKEKIDGQYFEHLDDVKASPDDYPKPEEY